MAKEKAKPLFKIGKRGIYRRTKEEQKALGKKKPTGQAKKAALMISSMGKDIRKSGFKPVFDYGELFFR